MGRRDQNRPPKKPKITVPDFPTFDNCSADDPDMFAVPALVGLPGMNGAPLPMMVKMLRRISRRLWDCGFRYHPELRTIKYRKPRVGQPHWLSNPGTWVPIGEPDEEETPEQVAKNLSPEQKAALRKRFGLDDPPPAPKVPEDGDKVPVVRADGSTVMLTRAQARRWSNARKARAEAEDGDGQ